MERPVRMRAPGQTRLPTGSVADVQDDALNQTTTAMQRWPGVKTGSFAMTHGLPTPDGPLYRGNIFRLLLAPLCPEQMLNLGAGKGNFSLSAADLGWEVTTVGVRIVQWPGADTCTDLAVAERMCAIRWNQADGRTYPIAPGQDDRSCILGLLHHLALVDQIALLRCSAEGLLLLDTRIAPAILDQIDRYESMAIRKHDEHVEEQKLVPTEALVYAVSFRLAEESLPRVLRDCGYPQVMPRRPRYHLGDTFDLCFAEPYRTRMRRGCKGRVQLFRQEGA